MVMEQAGSLCLFSTALLLSTVKLLSEILLLPASILFSMALLLPAPVFSVVIEIRVKWLPHGGCFLLALQQG